MIPELVFTHHQEYMFFDLLIQLVNALLLSYITITLIRIKYMMSKNDKK